MRKEDRELLLKDLCSRLPYKILCTDLRHGDSVVTSIDLEDGLVYCFDFDEWIEIEQCKPYLRPMSSMTEEESEEYRSIDSGSYSCPIDYAHIPASDRIDWFNAHHFDYRYLLEKGLAIEVTKENNPYKK